MSWTVNSRDLSPQALLNEESLFSLANGYLGVRGNFEEGYGDGMASIRGTYINAFYDTVDIAYGEKFVGYPVTQQKLLNVIDAQTITIALVEEESAEEVSLFAGEVLAYERVLRLDQGVSERRLHWRSPRGKEVKLTFKRLVSFTKRELFLQEVTVEPVNFYGTLQLTVEVNGDVENYTAKNDPRVATGDAKRLTVTRAGHRNGTMFAEAVTERSKLQTACAVACDLSVPFEREDAVTDTAVQAVFTCDLTQTVIFTKKNVFTDTLRHGEQPLARAGELVDGLKAYTFKEAAEAQAAYLRRFWQTTDVQINGEAKLQEAIRFNLYHLLQAVGRDRHANIAAKGLSGEGYEGHYFWDTEIYMLPVFSLTNPELAKHLLLYRHTILKAARARAREMGHKQGALYPWRTIDGSECSAYYPAGTAQYHISGDVAYSYVQYYLATKDVDFLVKYGAEVLFETARLWLDVGHEQDGAFKIDAVTGPDEYTCIVNNNYYTNAMAKYNLTWAAKVYALLQEKAEEPLRALARRIKLTPAEVSTWQQAAERMYLPYDPERGINPQDDTFLQKAVWDFANTPKENYPLLLHYHPLTLYRHQVCKQADTVLAHFLLEDEQPFAVIKNSYDYYEQITTHDSSLSSCVYSMMAAKVGYEEKAYRYFTETARLDLDNLHGNTKDGLHMANMGGTWLAIVFGFAGLRLKETGISFAPMLPREWQSYAFNLMYEGNLLRVTVTEKEMSIQLVEGERLNVAIDGRVYKVNRAAGVKVPLIRQ